MFRAIFFAVFMSVVTALSAAGGAQVSGSAQHASNADFGGLAASQDTRTAASWIAANADNQRLPF